MFIMSNYDEIVPKNRYITMLNSFGEKCFIKNKPMLINTNTAHGTCRDEKILTNSVKHILSNANK